MKQPLDIDLQRERRIQHVISKHISVVQNLMRDNLQDILRLSTAFKNCFSNNGKVIFMGNGGSAADCQHLAAEFVGRFLRKRNPLPALALTTDTSIITAISNDFSYEDIFERQIMAFATANDLVVGISTSGNSKNVIKAIQLCNRRGITTACLTGMDGGQLANLTDYTVIVRDSETARIQEAHILIGHILCDHCDEYFS